MSCHSLGRPLFLLRSGQHRVPLFSIIVPNALSSSRSSFVGKTSTSGRKVPRHCLPGQVPSEEGGVGRSLGCTYPTNILEKRSPFRWLWRPHTAQKHRRVVDSVLYALEAPEQAYMSTRRTQIYVNPCAISPLGIAERALQQFVRRKSDKKPHGTSKAATASNSGGDKQRGTHKKKLGSPSDQGKPPTRTADVQRVSRSASVQKTNADPTKKKGSRKSSTNGAEIEGKPMPKSSVLPVSQKTPPRSVSGELKPPSRSVNAQKVSRSSSMQQGNAEPDKKKHSRKPAAGGDRTEEKVVPNVPVSPESLYEFRYSRSSKPGGSSANKSETKVALHVPLKALEAYYGVPMEKLADDPRGKVNKKGELIITSEKHASQALNKKECMQKLDDMLISLHELYIVEEQKTPYVIDEETHKKYKFNILVRKKKEQYQRKCNQVSVRDL